MFGNHGLGGLLEECAHEKSPKCLCGNLGDFGGILQRSHTDFTVEQDGGVGLNVQNIGSGTGGNLEHKKFKQFLLNSLA